MNMKAQKKILILDNYDSFTYNLVQIVEELEIGSIAVKRNDEIEIKDIEVYDYLIFSPGPGLPEDAGVLKEIIETYKGKKKMFGVCLGLQAIGEVFGCSLKNLTSVFHGQQTQMQLTEIYSPIFENITKEFDAGRYHSWVIDKETINDELKVTAIDADREIMAVQHKTFEIFGVQFHPESIMTPDGKKMITNFLNL